MLTNKMKNVPGNYYDKHNSKNPFVKYLMKNFHKVLLKHLVKLKPTSILDVGCGEGYTTKIMIKKFPKVKFVACDLEKSMVEIAKRTNPEIKIYERSVYELKFKSNSFDVVVMNEVLEHVKDYNKALDECKRVAKKACVFSVPNEPYWRIANILRLRYLKDLGNTPGHVNNFTKSQFKKVLKKHFRKVIVVNAYLWNFGICLKKI